MSSFIHSFGHSLFSTSHSTNLSAKRAYFASSLMKSFHIKFRVINAANAQNSIFANSVCTIGICFGCQCYWCCCCNACIMAAVRCTAAVRCFIVVFGFKFLFSVDFKTTLINNYGKFFSSCVACWGLSIRLHFVQWEFVSMFAWWMSILLCVNAISFIWLLCIAVCLVHVSSYTDTGFGNLIYWLHSNINALHMKSRNKCGLRYSHRQNII